MLWYTHLAFGFLMAVISLPFLNYGNMHVFFVFVLAGALLPDIDQPASKIGKRINPISNIIKMLFGHRGVIHSVWAMLIFCGLFWYFVNRTYGAALFLGFFSHLIADSMTKMGVNLLHPVANLHLSGFIETGSTAEMVLFVAVIVLSVILLM